MKSKKKKKQECIFDSCSILFNIFFEKKKKKREWNISLECNNQVWYLQFLKYVNFVVIKEKEKKKKSPLCQKLPTFAPVRAITHILCDVANADTLVCIGMKGR